MKPVVAISACLCGEGCRYDGQAVPNELFSKLENELTLLPVCPEVDGGLPIPRPPAEIKDDRVITEAGRDVTSYFEEGAEACLEKAQAGAAIAAILKSRSPSCGVGQVYSGDFDRKLVDGDGLFTRALKREGIACISNENVPEMTDLIKELKKS